MVDEAVGGKHLEHVRQLDQNLADGAGLWHVFSDNLQTNKQNTFWF